MDLGQAGTPGRKHASTAPERHGHRNRAGQMPIVKGQVMFYKGLLRLQPGGIQDSTVQQAMLRHTTQRVNAGINRRGGQNPARSPATADSGGDHLCQLQTFAVPAANASTSTLRQPRFAK